MLLLLLLLNKINDIKVDTLIPSKATSPISTHVLNTPIAVYINQIYYPNKYLSTIKSHCGECDARGLFTSQVSLDEKKLIQLHGNM